MRMFATRWKLRARKQSVLSSSQNQRRASVIDGIKADLTPQMPRKKERTKSKAAVEIQRHIRGYFARKKIGQILAKKVENAVEANDQGELDKVCRNDLFMFTEYVRL